MRKGWSDHIFFLKNKHVNVKKKKHQREENVSQKSFWNCLSKTTVEQQQWSLHKDTETVKLRGKHLQVSF